MAIGNTHDHDIVQRLRRDLLAGCEDPEGDRQIEAGSLLPDVSGRQIDHHPAHREVERRIQQGSEHPVGGLLHCGIREPDDSDAGGAVSGIHLDFDGNSINADDGG